VRTQVREGVKRAADVEHADLAVGHADDPMMARRKFLGSPDGVLAGH
jgi:hypothetical protein